MFGFHDLGVAGFHDLGVAGVAGFHDLGDGGSVASGFAVTRQL